MSLRFQLEKVKLRIADYAMVTLVLVLIEELLGHPLVNDNEVAEIAFSLVDW